MTKFAIFNSEGFPYAFYSEDVHGSRKIPVFGEAPEPTQENPEPVAPVVGEADNPDCKIPADAVEITDEQWQEFLSHQGLRKWDGDTVIEYAPPEPDPLTPEELREQMPTLTSRQFWLAANTLGITEDTLVAATDDAEIIIEIRKATEFHRTYDSVVLLAPLMGITPEQLDDVWMWATAV